MVNPKDILYVSRISGARICFYLSNKQLVDRLIENKATVKINNEDLEIKPLVSKAKRIIISNVQPCLPTSLIVEELNKLNISPISRITTMKAGMQSSVLSHLLSFRKQVYLAPEDVPKIPPHMRITYENVNYWIYFSSEKMICFECKEEGHLAKYCKNIEKTLTQNIPGSQVHETTHAVISESEPILEGNENKDHTATNAQAILTTPGGFKRPYCSSTSNSSNQEISENRDALRGKSTKVMQAKKKAKETTGDTTDYVDQLEPARNHVESNIDKYPISYNKLREFLVNTRGKSNVIETALMYTNDLKSLHVMLTDVYVHLNQRNIKSRITRIRNILHENDENVSGFLTDDSSHADDNIKK